MKKLFLGICYCLLSSCLMAQSIRGKITDAVDGSAVAAATVELENTGITVSNVSGNFSFNRISNGNYPIRISAIGFRTFEGFISTGDSTVKFVLERLNLFMQPVEVKAIRAGEKAPFTKTNISGREIEKLNLGQDLPYLLNQTPSVIINSDAGNGIGYTGIRIRGSDATRINMTINGIPYNDAESQGLFFVNLPDLASSVNNIQIQRGVGTSSNGAGAFGATINFSTNEVNTNPYAELNNSIGSFNTRKHTVKAGTGLINEHFTLDARLSKISSDGFIDRASTDLRSIYISGAYLTPKTSLRINIISGQEKTYQAWNGVSENDLKNNRTINYAGMEKPGEPYENETDNYQQDHYQFFVNHQFTSRLTFNTALFLTRGKGYYEQYKAGEAYADYGLPNFTINNDTLYETDIIRQLWLDNYFYGQVLSLQYKDKFNELTVGGGWNKYEGSHFGEIIWATAGVSNDYRWYDNSATKNDMSGYVKYQRNIIDALEIFGDIQFRKIHYELKGFRNNPDLQINNTYNFLNPKFGLSFSSGSSQFYASYSQANKEPNRDDFEAGINQQPRPEKLHDLELGWEIKNPLYSFGTTLYYMLYKDQLVLTGKVNDVGAYTRTNIPESFRMGIEFQATSRIAKWLTASGNLTLSRNRIQNFTEYFDDYDNGGQKTILHGSTDIAYSPSVTAAASLDFVPFRRFEIGLPAKYISRQYLDNTSDINRSLDPFYVQDIRLSYAINKKLFRTINLLLQVNNVFNKKYEPNGYTYSYLAGGDLVTENFYFPMSGTNVLFGVNLKF